MTAILILLAASTLLEAAILAVLAAIWRVCSAKAAEARPAQGEAAGERPQEKSRAGSMDEGFENLMQYAVKGRTGFERDTAGY